MKPALVLIGPGRVGCALGLLLRQAGYPLAAIIARKQQQAEVATQFIGCDLQRATTDLKAAAKGTIVLLTLPDDQLAKFSEHLHDQVELAAETTLIHCSGLHPASLLQRRRDDIGLLSIHPLLPFADRQSAVKNLQGCPCAIEGDQDRLEIGQQLVSAFGGQPFLLPTEAKRLYHTAACIASNFMVSLTACARDLLCDCGFDSEQAMQLLAPLHRATSDNILEQGPEQALTGPILRGDIGTVAIHLKTLHEHSPPAAELYRNLATATLTLARQGGRLAQNKAQQIERLLEK